MVDFLILSEHLTVFRDVSLLLQLPQSSQTTTERVIKSSQCGQVQQ